MIFADTQFGQLKTKRHSAVMVRSEDDVYWLALTLVLFRLRIPGGNAWTKSYSSVRYFDITRAVDKLDLALYCVCLRWVTGNETDHNTAFNSLPADNFEIGEWYDLLPLLSIVSVSQILRSKNAAKELAPQLP